ncbi:MAG: CHAD domain-containing protein [Bacteroidales bacterium]|nr:CHAD domain-containing protein [Bacteroidales bacterium]
MSQSIIDEMLMGKNLNNYLLDLFESIEQNIYAYMKDRKPEYIHNLRLDIKKIDAIISFAEKLFKEKHDASKLKPLFMKAGKVRELQIIIQLIITIPYFPQRLITQLKKKENTLVQQFINNGSRYILLIRQFREKVDLPDTLPGKRAIKKYFNREKIKAELLLQLNVRDGLHAYRKKIKKMMYVYLALPGRLKKKINLDEAEIDKQQKKLGIWHDTYSAIHFLSLVPLPGKTMDEVLKLKEKEERQFKALHKKLSTCHK